MTTPRVYTRELLDDCSGGPMDSFIILSDHKEVVESLKAELHLSKIEQSKWQGISDVKDQRIEKLSAELAEAKAKLLQATNTLDLVLDDCSKPFELAGYFIAEETYLNAKIALNELTKTATQGAALASIKEGG
jgi:hypothetical protein